MPRFVLLVAALLAAAGTAAFVPSSANATHERCRVGVYPPSRGIRPWLIQTTIFVDRCQYVPYAEAYASMWQNSAWMGTSALYHGAPPLVGTPNFGCRPGTYTYYALGTFFVRGASGRTQTTGFTSTPSNMPCSDPDGWGVFKGLSRSIPWEEPGGVMVDDIVVPH